MEMAVVGEYESPYFLGQTAEERAEEEAQRQGDILTAQQEFDTRIRPLLDLFQTQGWKVLEEDLRDRLRATRSRMENASYDRADELAIVVAREQGKVWAFEGLLNAPRETDRRRQELNQELEQLEAARS